MLGNPSTLACCVHNLNHISVIIFEQLNKRAFDMVFYDNFAKPSPSRRSMSIEGTVYYDKSSPTKESCFCPTKQKIASPQKPPKTPIRAMLRGTSQPSLSPSKTYVKQLNDLPFRDFPLNQVTPTQIHSKNTIEFSTLDGLSSPSVELNNHGSAVSLNNSTSSLYLVDLDKPIGSKHVLPQSTHSTVTTVSSWSNLDFCIALPDSEIGTATTENTKKKHARKTMKPKILSHAPTTPTKQQSRDSRCEITSYPVHASECRPPESPMRRLVRRISKTHINNSAAGVPKKFGRRLSLGQTEQMPEEHNTKSFFSPKSQLRKQISAFDLSSSSSSRHNNKTVGCKKPGKKMSLNHSESDEFKIISNPVPKSPLKKQISAIDLSTPERERSCFPRWRALDVMGDEISSPLDTETFTGTAMIENEWAVTRPPSPSKKFMRSPSKQVSERLISSPKWVASHTEGRRGVKKASIPKVSSIQVLLSEFDKIMELP